LKANTKVKHSAKSKSLVHSHQRVRKEFYKGKLHRKREGVTGEKGALCVRRRSKKLGERALTGGILEGKKANIGEWEKEHKARVDEGTDGKTLLSGITKNDSRKGKPSSPEGKEGEGATKREVKKS